jgi:hypothetical protein
MVKFKLSKSFDKDETELAKDILERYAQTNLEIRDLNAGRIQKDLKPLPEITNAEIIKELKKEGLSYRRKNMLEDIRRLDATIRATNETKRDNAERWFDNVYEKFRKEEGLSSKEATKKWNRAVLQTADTIKDAEENAQFWDYYHDEFGE